MNTVSCLCGGLRFEAASRLARGWECDCEECRKARPATLSVHASSDPLPDDRLRHLGGSGAQSLHPPLRVRVESPSCADAQALITALDQDLAGVYPPEVIFGLHEDDHDEARMIFLVARLHDRPVACGALRSLDANTGEVKRMYVVPEVRGSGISRRLLGIVEDLAIGRRHRRLRLETGNQSPAALALYRSNGYREISLYAEYVGNAYSVCFEKEL